MKTFLSKYWPLIGIGILLIVVSLYLLDAHNAIIKGTALKAAVPKEGIRLKDIHYTQNDPDDAVKWTLDAKEVRFTQNNNFFSFMDFRLKLAPENKPAIELKGKKGDYNKNSGEINLRGGLQGYSDSGYRIMTDHILYNQKEGILKTEKPVKIIGPFFSISGKGMSFNVENEILQIKSDVMTLVDKKLK